MKIRRAIKKFLLGTGIILFGLFAFYTGASAATIESSLGNTNPGFSDGDILPASTVGGAQAGQPIPFDQGYGTEGVLFGATNFNVNWTHSLAVITDTIIGASISFGIWDHDTSATGSQLESFTVEGTALTTQLDGLFEAGGGSLDSEYNVYSIDLGSELFSDLSDGTVNIGLALQGLGLTYALFPSPGIIETSTNGASLIFSTLTIETRDSQPPPIPEPASLLLTMFGLCVMAFFNRRGHRQGS